MTPSVSTPKDQAREDERVEKAREARAIAAYCAFYRTPRRPWEKVDAEDRERWCKAVDAAASVSISPADPVRAALEEILQTLNDQATPAPWYHRQAGATGNNTPLDWIGDAPDGQPHSKIILGRQCLYGGSSDYAFVAAAVLYVRNYVVPAALATLSNPPVRQGEVSVDVQTMKTSKGADYYVRVACGDRSCTPHMFVDRYKAEYEVAHWQWIFGQREEEPYILDYSEETYPNLYQKMDVPSPALVHPPQEGGREGWEPGDLAINARYERGGVYPAFGESAFVQRIRESHGHIYLGFGPDGQHTYLSDRFDKALPAAPTPSPAVPGSGEGK